MKKTLAFIETKDDRTALIVLTGKKLFNTLFCVQIQHQGGAECLHPVTHHMTLADAMAEARKFLDHPPPPKGAPYALPDSQQQPESQPAPE